jgi:AAA15 family ATPase/GTPase
MEHLIVPADVGICDVVTRREAFKLPDEVREQLTKDPSFAIPENRVVVSFVHQGSSKRPIDFDRESSGTRKLFSLGSDWWTLANDPVTLHADELSASLHPRLLERLIRAVNDPPSKKTKSQLIFATHDTGLLEGHDGQPPGLRRDQVYFTRKDRTGATELYSLSEFKEDARPVHNIRKRYLSGLYNAIPSVDKMSL